MKVNEEVIQIEQKIEKLDENGAFYPGKNSPDQAVAPIDYVIKEDVFVFQASEMYAAKILEIKGDNQFVLYKVTYNGWNKKFDEYVGSEKMMKRSRTSEEIQSKLKKYKNSLIEKPKEDITSNQKRRCKRKSNTNEKEIESKKNKNKKCNIKTMSFEEIVQSTFSEDQMIDIDDDYLKYQSKRTIAKKYEDQITKILAREKATEDEKEKLKDENEELKSALIYHTCVKCKKYYSAFRKNKNKNVVNKVPKIEVTNASTEAKMKDVPKLGSEALVDCQHVNGTTMITRTNIRKPRLIENPDLPSMPTLH